MRRDREREEDCRDDERSGFVALEEIGMMHAEHTGHEQSDHGLEAQRHTPRHRSEHAER